MEKYIGFKYNAKTLGIDESSDFTGFIKNDLDDLIFVNKPNSLHNFNTVLFGEHSIYTGKEKINKEFNLETVLYGITLKKYREFLAWLNLDDQGVLVFDYSPNYGFLVKVTEVSNANFMVDEGDEEDSYIIELSITFTTLYDWASFWIHEVYYKSNDELHENLIDNEDEEYFLIGSEVEGIFQITLKNWHNIENYYKIEFNDNLIITDGGFTILDCQVQGEEVYTYYSQFGIVLDGDGNFVDCEVEKFKILAGESKELDFLLSDPEEKYFKITPISREIL